MWKGSAKSWQGLGPACPAFGYSIELQQAHLVATYVYMYHIRSMKQSVSEGHNVTISRLTASFLDAAARIRKFLMQVFP